MRLLEVVVSLLLCVASAIPSLAADRIPVVNRTEIPIEVWLWDGQLKTWLTPPLHLPVQHESAIRFKDDRYYYVVVRTTTADQQESVFGWMDFRKLLQRSPAAALVIDSHPFTKPKEVSYIVEVPHHETRTMTRTICSPRFANGCWYWVPEEIVEECAVKTYTREQRTTTVSATQYNIEVNALTDNFPLRSRVTFETTPQKGAFVIYRLAARDETHISNNPTTTEQDIPVGIYVIWTVRNGEITSRKHNYDIYESQVKITIPENSP